MVTVVRGSEKPRQQNTLSRRFRVARIVLTVSSETYTSLWPFSDIAAETRSRLVL